MSRSNFQKIHPKFWNQINSKTNQFTPPLPNARIKTHSPLVKGVSRVHIAKMHSLIKMAMKIGAMLKLFDEFEFNGHIIVCVYLNSDTAIEMHLK